jgi:hypothetical protein
MNKENYTDSSYKHCSEHKPNIQSASGAGEMLCDRELELRKIPAKKIYTITEEGRNG